MKRLPSTKWLREKILERGRARDSLQYLQLHSSTLASYTDLESFALSTNDADAPTRTGIEFHFVALRSALVRELWSRQFFIGTTVVDGLLFDVLRAGIQKPVLRLLEVIRDHGLHHPGLLVFPTHSFGIMAAGFLHSYSSTRVEYAAPEHGLMLCPQTNDLQRTLDVLRRACAQLQIARRIPQELIEHWYRSRTDWLTKNPLLLVRTQAYSGSYYENEFLIMTKLRVATATFSMLAVLQRTPSDPAGLGFSSRSVNNFETLNIRHYIVLYADPSNRSRLDGHCVPMHMNPSTMAEESELGFDFDPRQWRRRNETVDQVHKAVTDVQQGFVRFSFGLDSQSPQGRIYRKLYESLSFFRRSFHRVDSGWSCVVSLAVAFEMLLTDSYSSGVRDRVMRRVGMLLKGVRGVRKFTTEVGHLYEARGGIVHKGSSHLEFEMNSAQTAFVLAFIRLVSRLPRFNPRSATPLRDLCGDTE
ncbi:MAG: hypothetical protein AAF735_08415 [Myxococcota bacterium]